MNLLVSQAILSHGAGYNEFSHLRPEASLTVNFWGQATHQVIHQLQFRTWEWRNCPSFCYPRIKKMDPIKQNKANPSSSSSNKSFRMASLTCLRNRVGSWNTKHQQTLFAPMLCSRWSSHFGLGAGWEWQACLRCKTPCPNARSTIVIDIYNHRYFRTFTCYILSVSKCLICQTHVVPSYTIHLAIKQSHGRRLTLGNGYLRSRNQSHSTIRLI